MNNEIYLNLPSWAQNISLSIYGASLYRQRFSSPIPALYLNNLDLFEKPNPSLFVRQEIRLQELLLHCKKHVPFYEKYLKNIDTSKITSASLKDIIPTLTKSDVQNNADSLTSRSPSIRNKLRTANTSGSSGTPLSIRYTDESRRINYHFYESALKQFGCDYQSRSTTFAGRVLYKKSKNNPARYDYYNRTQYLSSYFISASSIESYVDSLNKWKPEFIDAYPSALYELIKLKNEKKLNFTFSPKCILTSSETLTSEYRSAIENAFKTTVIDHYGCTEMAINAFSTGQQYFLNPLYSVIELDHLFDSSYSVITTGLLNFGMPLLRYKIGDIIEGPSSFSNYIVNRIEGREDDVIVTPEGKKIGRMDPVFKGVEGINNAQIIQEDFDLITVLIVLDKNNSIKFNKDLMIENIKARTSRKICIQIKYVDEISKTKNGKFKSVISKIKHKN